MTHGTSSRTSCCSSAQASSRFFESTMVTAWAILASMVALLP